jgi:hypothetical protein
MCSEIDTHDLRMDEGADGGGALADGGGAGATFLARTEVGATLDALAVLLVPSGGGGARSTCSRTAHSLCGQAVGAGMPVLAALEPLIHAHAASLPQHAGDAARDLAAQLHAWNRDDTRPR